MSLLEKLEERSGTAIQGLGLTPSGEPVKFSSYTRPKPRMERAIGPSVLDDEEALSYLNSTSRPDS
eukprot:COSAG02_NODE_898_length_16108_cov_5.877444_7_plen_66_part_00